MENSKFVFTGIVLKESSSFSLLCPEVDVASEGETVAEAKANLMEAVSLYIESAVENKVPVLRLIPEEENPLIKCPGKILDKLPLEINFAVYTNN
jgi:predicted RNase H-like HicB family nuclease